MRGDQLTREFADEVKTGIDIDRTHLFPCRVTDRERMIGLAPRRRCAVNEMRHLPDGRARLRQQRIAGTAFREIANPGQASSGRGEVLTASVTVSGFNIREYGAHALADQRLRDRASDAVSRTGHQRCLPRRIEWRVEQTHRTGLPDKSEPAVGAGSAV